VVSKPYPEKEHTMKSLGIALVIGLITCAFSQAADKPAKKQLSVKEETSGILVVVKDDDRSLLAKDKGGNVLWEVDVIKIKKAGPPAVGQPVVRHLSLKDGKVTAVYGKHSFADFDLKTGKLLSSGSD
jgi:hypothetical protein